MDEGTAPVEPVSNEPATSKPRRRWLKFVGYGLLAALAFAGWLYGSVLYDFFRAGFFDKTKMRTYAGASIDNLKAMHMAMMVYHESEEMFPDSNAWMEAVESRIQVYDMKKEESFKKLVAPQYRDQKGKYGYAMNDACSRKYKDDIPNPAETPLLFESSDTSRNAHGDPSTLKAEPSQGISVEGQLLKL